MSMRLLSLALVCFILFSCSKQESTTTEITTTPEFEAAPTPAGAKQAELTPGQIQKVAWQTFRQLHFQHVPDDSISLAYVEEFEVTGDRVQYTLLRHNGERIGWIPVEEDSYGGVGPYAGGEDESPYGGSEDPGSKMYYYKDQIDTLIYNGTYVAYVEGETEKGVTSVRVVFTGLLRHENFYMQQSGDEDEPLEKSPIDYQVGELLVDLQSPIVVDGDEIYLRAKVADLTDQDLAGMTKDQLSYTRNEIFARHGHTFKTAKMMKYFDDRYWHHAIIDDAVSLLNKFEKRNVEFIKKKEG